MNEPLVRITPGAGDTGNNGLQLDFLQNIVNVHWGGLAVVFGPEAIDAPPRDTLPK